MHRLPKSSNSRYQSDVSRRIYSDGDHRPIFTSGLDGYIIDEKGNKFYDFILGFGPVVLGHTYPGFLDTVFSRLSGGLMLPSFGPLHDEYLGMLVGNQSNSGAILLKTGSEAVLGAIRLARAANRKEKVIRCGYLGWHDIQFAGSPKWHEPPSTRLSFDRRPTAFSFVPDTAYINWLDLRLDSLAPVLTEHGSQICALVIDAMQVHFNTDLTISKLSELCVDHNIVLVVDETKTSGRISRPGSAAVNDSSITVLGKALGNGAPISAIVGPQRLLEAAPSLRLGGTYAKEMFSVACGITTHRIMDKEDGYEVLRQTGTKISDVLNECADSQGLLEHIAFETMFGGGMLLMRFGAQLAKQEKSRRYLRDCFFHNNILLLEGHPFFVCLQHAGIDLSDLAVKAERSLKRWAETYLEVQR